MNSTATLTRIELHASSPDLCFLAHPYEPIAEGDEMHVFREEVDCPKRVIFHTSFIPEVVEGANQRHGQAETGSKKTLEWQVHSYYRTEMKNYVQLLLGTSRTCDKFHNASKMERAKLNPIATNHTGEIHAIDVFGGKASIPQKPLGNRYILKMDALFPNFGVAASMPDQSAQTVRDALL